MRCPPCGHDTTKPASSFMAVQTAETDWRLVLWTATFVVATLLVLAAVHSGVLG